MIDPGFKDHFSARAKGYAQFRPSYPAALFDWLAGLAPGCSLAWDAGTGSGQAARPLAERFERVVATDASAQQIDEAEPHPRIAYRIARERDSGLAEASCDLVTAAQALHWFDIPAFFAEARRVLLPGGVIAVWTYAGPALDEPGSNEVLQEYVRLMDPWWPPERTLVETGYRTVAFPFVEVSAPPFELDLHPTRAELEGYLRTWSAHQRYTATHGDDPVVAVEARLAPIWPAGERRRLHWPLTVRAGRSGH